MDDTETDKSEQPTLYKLQSARRKGTVARGMDLGYFGALSGFLIFALMSIDQLGGAMAAMMRAALVAIPLADGLGIGALSWKLFALSAGPLMLLAVIVFGVVLLLELLQTGVVFSAQPLRPDFSRLNPAKGLKRLFSLRLLIETAKNVFKLAAYGAVAWLLIDHAASTWHPAISDGSVLARALEHSAFRMLAAFIGLAFLFAVIDQLIARRDFTRRMRMSRREVKREHREREGEPRMRQKRKQLHGEFVKTSRSLRGLREADILIVNPVHVAVALRYDDRTMLAPRLVSAGRDRMAQRLRRLAILYNVPVHEDRELARALFRQGQLDRDIPDALFQPVANLYKILRQRAGKSGGQVGC